MRMSIRKRRISIRMTIMEIIQESLGAIFPQVVDVVHRWRLFFKT